MVDPALLAQFQALSGKDRLELINAGWGTIGEVPVAMTPDERLLIEERLRDLEDRPDDEVPWDVVKADLRRRWPLRTFPHAISDSPG